MSEPMFHFHCPKCGWVRAAPAMFETEQCASCGHLFKLGAGQMVSPIPPDMVPEMLAAQQAAAGSADVASDETIGHAAAKDLVARMGAVAGSPAISEPAAASAPVPAPAARAAAPVAPRPAPDKRAGWTIFAVGCVIALLAFPIGQALMGVHVLVGTAAMLGLLAFGLRGIYGGLRDALGIGPGVAALLAFFALGPLTLLAMTAMEAIGMGVLGDSESSESRPVAG
ncbi:hypothetical protein [Stakelama tenebrarum]|uniref:Uncharacterized protein n=1 Tax=Stakelama tenebrarum TaxID=2711215 RepID=A0A6G6Y1E0_9SPHN|nr:hypothetical protein [Sphingosinithalassobacter tenebrarum]QIG78742.1 hypothetical protein G5C33_02335 [Sphingosinithalassobacter tenebrarum]